MRHLVLCCLCFCALVALPATGRAATITLIGTTTVAGDGIAPGSATDYDFFGGVQPSILTDFTVTRVANSQYSGNVNYTRIIVPGGSTLTPTGITYDSTHRSPAATVIATFSALTDGDFYLWIFDGNTNGDSVGNTSVGLGVNGEAAITSGPTANSGINEFTEYRVTGAVRGDVFQLYATNANGNFASLGGVTFSAITPSQAPEPSTFYLGLTALGFGLPALKRRFNRQVP